MKTMLKVFLLFILSTAFVRAEVECKGEDEWHVYPADLNVNYKQRVVELIYIRVFAELPNAQDPNAPYSVTSDFIKKMTIRRLDYYGYMVEYGIKAANEYLCFLQKNFHAMTYSQQAKKDGKNLKNSINSIEGYVNNLAILYFEIDKQMRLKSQDLRWLHYTNKNVDDLKKIRFVANDYPDVMELMVDMLNNSITDKEFTDFDKHAIAHEIKYLLMHFKYVGTHLSPHGEAKYSQIVAIADMYLEKYCDSHKK